MICLYKRSFARKVYNISTPKLPLKDETPLKSQDQTNVLPYLLTFFLLRLPEFS